MCLPAVDVGCRLRRGRSQYSNLCRVYVSHLAFVCSPENGKQSVFQPSTAVEEVVNTPICAVCAFHIWRLYIHQRMAYSLSSNRQSLILRLFHVLCTLLAYIHCTPTLWCETVLGQVNHLAPFYLTDLLLPNLKQAHKGAQRMVEVLQSPMFIIQ